MRTVHRIICHRPQCHDPICAMLYTDGKIYNVMDTMLYDGERMFFIENDQGAADIVVESETRPDCPSWEIVD